MNSKLEKSCGETFSPRGSITFARGSSIHPCGNFSITSPILHSFLQHGFPATYTLPRSADEFGRRRALFESFGPSTTSGLRIDSASLRAAEFVEHRRAPEGQRIGAMVLGTFPPHKGRALWNPVSKRLRPSGRTKQQARLPGRNPA